MKKNILSILCFWCITFGFAQNYQFKTLIDIEATDVISQGRTGTCWSFSTSSFLESEIIRLTGQQVDLSEMYTVRQTYPKKAWHYIMRQGKTQFSQGGLAHDVINSVAQFGIVPQSAYSGLDTSENGHNHAELIAVLKAVLDTYIKKPSGHLSPKWKTVTESVLDTYLGKKVSSFNYNGIQYTPKSFLEFTKINPNNYITLTSFTHAPFYTSFILNIPDNFSNGSFYNVPLKDFMAVLDHALNKGYTIALDCDVSEKTFSSKHGVAVIPEDASKAKKALTQVVSEKQITQDYRQQEFENYNTTDDHLMHITGMLKDQNGNVYYKVKNSWGKNSDRVAHEGYVYMSASYIKLKAISIMLHKDGLTKSVAKALKL